jgi:hypothetical protein
LTYKLDTEKWSDLVEHKAVEITREFLDGKDPSTIRHLNGLEFGEKKDRHDWKKFTCDICRDPDTGAPRVLNGEHEWQIHLNSRYHRTAVRKKEGHPYSREA